MQTWIGIEGKQHAFVHARHGISRISACLEFPHPDIRRADPTALHAKRDTREGLPFCEKCKAIVDESE